MDLVSLRKSAHLSASSIVDYLSCGLQFKFGRIDRLSPEFIPDALEFGSAIHRVLADFYLARQAGHYMPITEMHAKFETYWSEAAKGNDRLKYKEGKDYETLLADGKALLSVYASSIPDTKYKVLAVEEPFAFEVPGMEIPVIGAIDLIEEDESGTLIITDHKTSSKSYADSDVHSSFQLSVYSIGMRNDYPNREILLKFDALIKTKVPKFESYYTTRDADDEARTIKKILNAYDGISKQVFLPNMESWKCSGCSFKTHCDEYMRS